MEVVSAESTQLFTGPPEAPLQIVRVRYRGATGAVPVRIEGHGLHGAAECLAEPGDGVVDVGVAIADAVIGQQRDAVAVCADSSLAFIVTVAEPGWTMFMVSHFHYDPVWWNTQAAYTSVWTEDPPGRCRQTNGFELVAAHLEMARRDPDYTFVLAEVDYLKPFWDTHPWERRDLRRLIGEGRVEIMGGTYNEPNTNLTAAETTIRNFVHGIGFQRDILGADPATAWQLDAFGHDPQFPAMAAGAGLTSSSWARGPHHQWGPMAPEPGAEDGRAGDPARMQFASEFEWIGPSGRGLLTHYMPAHYAAGWWMDSAASLADAEAATYELFCSMKRVALTRNVLLPVGTDYTPPNKWVTDIHRDWNARYTWPRFVCALPRDFFAAVRAELDERGVAAPPQTRDMNPIYTGKDVSYIDTKQANRAAEVATQEAEQFAVFAGLLTGATYPEAALAKAWVQLVYGAHHDAITGSESDQVYLDLLTGWRDAWQLGRGIRDRALSLLSSAVDGPVTVWNPLSHSRSDIVTLHVPDGGAARLVDHEGREVAAVADAGGTTLTWLANDVPSLGWRSYRWVPGDAPDGWEAVPGTEIGNAAVMIRADAARGGGLTSLRSHGRELIGAGAVGNELAVYDEYPAHPTAGEGPWHLLPSGPVVASSARAATSVQAYRSAVGERLVITGEIPGVLRYTQTVTLWRGLDRVDCSTTVDDFVGQDRLLRMRWPCPIPGAMPVSEVGNAVIGRGFALLHEPATGGSVDTAIHPYTLDNPAYGWFGLSSALRIRFRDGAARAISVAEVVSPTGSEPEVRELIAALARTGVTATCSAADAPRYGDLSVDSNLPDVRISIGGATENPFSAEVLGDTPASARTWVPAARPLRDVWAPGADLRDPTSLPVLVLGADGDTAHAIRTFVDDLADAEVFVDQLVAEHFENRTVALINRGFPGFAIETDGTLHASLMRSCTGWPSGTWIDPPRRTAPDGSYFGLQHWTHTFDYAIVAVDGDWRDAQMPSRAAEVNQPLHAVSAERDAGGGGLPPWGSLLEVHPERAVRIGAIKTLGNPTARGSAAHADPAGGVAVRLVETVGRDTDATVLSGLRDISHTRHLDLIEEPLEHTSRETQLSGYDMCTLHSELNLPRVLDADQIRLGPDGESVAPLYARYWLHNRGPAPLGGLPAVAHLHPHRRDTEPGARIPLRLTATSDATDATLHGRVRIVAPPRWELGVSELPFVLPPGEYLETAVAVTVPGDAAPGLYPVRAELAATGAAIPAAWHQTVEDVAVISVGRHDDVLVRIDTEPRPVEVVAGQRAQLSITVSTDAHTDLTLEAHLISPWGTWEWLGPNVTGALVPARGRVQVDFDVAPPAWQAPGRWWALVRVAAAGELRYSDCVAVTVR